MKWSRRKYIFLIFMLPLLGGSSRGSDVLRDCVASKLNESLGRDNAAWALGREITARQSEALSKAKTMGRDGAYAANELVRQNRILTRAGYSDSEISLMRRRGILGNTLIGEPSGVPSRVYVQDVTLGSLDSRMLHKIKQGQAVRYAIDTRGGFHVVTEMKPETPHLPSANDILVLRNPHTGEQVIAQEAGTLSWNSKLWNYEFKPEFGTPLSEEELAQAEKRLGLSSAPRKPKEVAAKSPNSPRTMNCLAIRNNQALVRNFILNKLMGTNLVLVSGIAGSELLGEGRLKTSEGRRTLLADAIQTNLGMAVSSATTGFMLARNFGIIATAIGDTTTTSSLLMIEKGLYGQLLKGDENSDASKKSTQIAVFDGAWYLARTPLIYATDWWTLKMLPDQIFNLCQKGSPLAIAFSPGLIRIYENVGFTLIYYGARKAIISQ